MPTARRALEHLLTRELPGEARHKVRERLRQLEAFPESGPRLEDEQWAGARVLMGPWWFVFVYVYDEGRDEVRVTAIKDKRTADAAGTSDPL